MRSDYSRSEQLTQLARHPVYLEPDHDGDEGLGDDDDDGDDGDQPPQHCFPVVKCFFWKLTLNSCNCKQCGKLCKSKSIPIPARKLLITVTVTGV